MSLPYPLPDAFIHTILDLHGPSGQKWLDEIPAFLSEFETRWNIVLQQPFDLTYNYVAPGTRNDGSEIVFKAGPINDELLSEIKSLRLWEGHGTVKLLEYDLEKGAMLLERLRPGETLAELVDDDRATQAAALLMRELWIPAPENPAQTLPIVPGWARGIDRLRAEFHGGTGPFPEKFVDAAENLFHDLIASSGSQRLLHGDLHHWNIISAQRRPWLAIDPKGVIGEPDYEPGALLRNRLPENLTRNEISRISQRRIKILCETITLDPQRVAGWAFAQAVLSAWWSYEDHRRIAHKDLLLAEALLDIRKD
jgi:streptomycin 6-kinase